MKTSPTNPSIQVAIGFILSRNAENCGANLINLNVNHPKNIEPKKFLTLVKNGTLGIDIPNFFFPFLSSPFSRASSLPARLVFSFFLRLSLNCFKSIFTLFLRTALIFVVDVRIASTSPSRVLLSFSSVLSPTTSGIANFPCGEYGTNELFGIAPLTIAPPEEGKNFWVLTATLLYPHNSVNLYIHHP